MMGGETGHGVDEEHEPLVCVGVMSALGYVTADMCPSCRRAWVRDLSAQPRPVRYVGIVRSDGSQVLDIDGAELLPR